MKDTQLDTNISLGYCIIAQRLLDITGYYGRDTVEFERCSKLADLLINDALNSLEKDYTSGKLNRWLTN